MRPLLGFTCLALLCSFPVGLKAVESSVVESLPRSSEVSQTVSTPPVVGPVSSEVTLAPEPSRVILLVAGVCFLLFAYRSAWYNLKTQ